MCHTIDGHRWPLGCPLINGLMPSHTATDKRVECLPTLLLTVERGSGLTPSAHVQGWEEVQADCICPT